MKNIIQKIKDMKNKRIIVLGDIILDEYLVGQVKRISPEAPVPVHSVESEYQRVGGAANVAANIKTLGGEPVLIGCVGTDFSAQKVRGNLKEIGVSTEYLSSFDGFMTPTKIRITTKHQQLIRLDHEQPIKFPKKVYDELFETIKSVQSSCLIISDYAKGLFTPEFLKKILKHAKDNNVFVIVDPKDKNFEMYTGANLVTPNLKEACEAANIEYDPNTKSFDNITDVLHSKFNIENLLVTLGSDGMILSKKNNTPHIREKSKAQEVYDVSGAGDTVVASAAIAYLATNDLTKAIKFANHAAAISVSKWGTYAVTADDILKAESLSNKQKIYSTDELSKRTAKLSDVVFTNGCFDLLHRGHLEYLKEAKSLGKHLVVALNSDDSIKRLKGLQRPINPLKDRLEMMAALSFVDFVTWFEEDTPLNTIKAITPNTLVKGGDWKPKDIVGSDHVIENGGKVQSLQFMDGYSSTSIIEKILSHAKL